MGAILAGVIVMAVMVASLSLLHAHLEGVDEYNRRAAEVADAQRRAVHESVGVSAAPAGGGAHTVSMANERAEPVEIIEVRSMLENGTVASLPGFAGPVTVAGFGEESVEYDVPDGAAGEVTILAITSMGNTFSAEISAGAAAPDAARATVNGMGIGSRLAQVEHSGHVIYGSDTWSSMASLRPHVGVEGGADGVPPSFAALLLDSEAEKTVAITGYARGTLVTVAPDGTVSSAPKAQLISPAASRGTAGVSVEDGVLRVSGPGHVLLRLDPAMFGKTVFFDEDIGNRVRILTSPYGTLADPPDYAQLREKCGGLVWEYGSRRHQVPRHLAETSKTVAASQRSLPLDPLLNFVVYVGTAPELVTTVRTASASKSGTLEERSLHVSYWSAMHGIPTVTPWDRVYGRAGSDHVYRYSAFTGNAFPYHNHPGEYTVTYNSTHVRMPGPGLPIRDGQRAYVAYAPALESRIFVSQDSSEDADHAHHRVADVNALTVHHFDFAKSGSYYSGTPEVLYPSISASASREEKFSLYNQWSPYPWRYDSLFGLPIMEFQEGDTEHDEYVSLAGVTFNGINPSPSIRELTREGTPPVYRTVTDREWDRSLCVIASSPYVVERRIEKGTSPLTVTMPERDATHARHLYVSFYTPKAHGTLSAVTDDSIAGLAASAPYTVEADGSVLRAGITTARGTIPFIESLPGSFTLRTYPDSASYRGAFSTIVFDPHAGQGLRVASDEDRIYTVHTWAQVPVTGTVEVSDVEVRTREGAGLRLEYLDGEYSAGAGDGGRIWVPVIPGHFSIHMKVNGVDAVLRYSDVLGGTGIRVIPASTSTVSRASTDYPIESIGASAGTSAYALATSDMPLVAIVSGTMSGTAHIEHEHAAQRTRTCVRDPLTGWITAHKNGELVHESQRIVNYNPLVTRTSTVNAEGFGVTRATFEYSSVSLNETVVVDDVSAGDFVEFHVHANIYAEHSFPSVSVRSWCGFTVGTTHVSSSASATANIHGGSIIIG